MELNSKSYRPLILILFAVSIFSTACCSTKNMEQAAVEKTGLAKSAAEHFKIILSSGGGFTGLVKGYTLTSGGEVSYWQRFPNNMDSTIWKSDADIAKILGFTEELENSGILKQTYRQTGNTTGYLAYETTDTSYLWTWEKSSENIPQEIKEWYPKVMEYCNSLNK